MRLGSAILIPVKMCSLGLGIKMSINEKLLDMIKEVDKELDNHHDVIDGLDGNQKPNWAMNLQRETQELIARIGVA